MGGRGRGGGGGGRQGCSAPIAAVCTSLSLPHEQIWIEDESRENAARVTHYKYFFFFFFAADGEDFLQRPFENRCVEQSIALQDGHTFVALIAGWIENMSDLMGEQQQQQQQLLHSLYSDQSVSVSLPSSSSSCSCSLEAPVRRLDSRWQGSTPLPVMNGVWCHF